VTLPTIDGAHELDHATIDALRRDGHCCVRDLATADECAAFLPVITEGVDKWHPEPTPLDERSTYERAFLQAAALRSIHKPTRGFVDSPRFAKVAADLLGVDGVRLYHDQALFKEPGGGRTPWHQDQNYWPLDTDEVVTMWMPLADIDPAVGSMSFVDGSHLGRDVGAGQISDESDRTIEDSIAAGNRSITTHGALKAGDATFHKGWTIHSAGQNPTAAMRPVMTIIWFADGARITEATSPEQEFDLQTWLDGGDPGTLAASHRNPLLWPPAATAATGV